ncbi:MAG: hypothetical protein ABUT20_37125 [Bacteroidota bacterium]
MTWKLLIWFAFILAHAVRDYYLIEKMKTKPVYWRSFIYRATFSIGYTFLLFDVHNLYHYLVLLTFQATSFWVLFNMLLNVFRGEHPLYVGRHSGYIDSFLYKWPDFQGILIILAAVLCVISIIVIYQNG